MSKSRGGLRQKSVLYLEPKRAGATISHTLLALTAVAAVTAVVMYGNDIWPKHWWEPEKRPSDGAILITGAVTGFLALLFIVGAIVNGSRWHMARVIERMSGDPALASFFPEVEWSPSPQRAPIIPPLLIRRIKPRKLPRPRVKLRPVTSDHNTISRPPLQIAYLRLFENQPRLRTFMQGPWREFGHVHLLLSAGSVTPAQYRWARKSGTFAQLFIRSREEFLAAIQQPGAQPNPKGRYRLKNVGERPIRVWDRYGSYKVRALLCHGSFWKVAVDMLLERVDLVVLDLSGFTPNNAGTRYELQRVVDRFPVERVVFLADQRSNLKFLTNELEQSWAQMAAGSPNAVHEPKVAHVAVTDFFHESQQQPGRPTQMQSGQSSQVRHAQTTVQVRLVARRSQTRRLVAMAQDHVSQYARPASREQTVDVGEAVSREGDRSALEMTSITREHPSRTPRAR